MTRSATPSASSGISRALALLLVPGPMLARPVPSSRRETIARCITQLVAGGDALREFDEVVRATRAEQSRDTARGKV
jgi:hypothetical protein